MTMATTLRQKQIQTLRLARPLLADLAAALGELQDGGDTELIAELEAFPAHYAELVAQAEYLARFVPGEVTRIQGLMREIRNELRMIGKDDPLYGELQAQSDDLRRQLMDMLSHRRQVLNDLASAPEDYAALMEQAFGYDIAFAGEFEGQEYINQLTRLRDSNLAIVAKYDEIMAGTGYTGLDIFRQFFATSPYSAEGEDNRIMVLLGDNVGAEGAFYGKVPLGAIGVMLDEDAMAELDEDILAGYRQDLQTIYLGSQVSTATTTHEFYHQLDRYFGLALSDQDNPMGLPTYLRDDEKNTLSSESGFPFNRGFVDSYIIISGASSDDDNPEIFADLGMAATIDGMGLIVHSEGVGDAVAFRDGKNARDVECALQQYFRQILLGQTSDLTYEREQCE
jgi:hypothetical protein